LTNKLLYYSSSKTQNRLELYKDPGEIPYYLSKIYGFDAIIDDFYDPLYPDEKFRSVSLCQPNKPIFFNRIIKIFYVWLNAKKIDFLYLLQITPDSMAKMLAYRLGGGNGKIYLKLDLGLYEKKGKDLLIWDNMGFFLKIAHRLFKPLPDLYTVETKRAYARLAHSYYSDLIDKEKLYLMPNGFDPKILDELSIIPQLVSNKEKILLTVGRIGVHQKNTELLLDILAHLDINDWKMYIVGPIEDNFREKIDSFYSQNPELLKSVIFTGLISDTEKYLLYNRARVFILTSRHESYGFVLAEAAYMRNYLISTNVGISEELLAFVPGFISDEHEYGPFVGELQRIIDLPEDELNNLVPNISKVELTWEWIIKNNIGINKLIKG